MATVEFVKNNHKYIKFTGHPKLLKVFPDFLIIGPQRTGTTWLADNLRLHPEAFVTQPKELFYFNLLNKPDHFQYKSNDLSWYLEHFNVSFPSKVRRICEDLKKYRCPHSVRMRGEATASYAADTCEEIIDEILTINPKIKIILMVRNPIKRAWSHAKKDLLNKSFMNENEKKIGEVPVEKIMAFMGSPYQLACGNFGAMIDLWQKKVRDNLFVGFFDDIHDNPREFLLRIFEFLSLHAHEKYFSTKLNEIISPTDKSSNERELPDVYRDYLHNLFGYELENLQAKYARVLVR